MEDKVDTKGGVAKPAHYCPDWDFLLIYPGDQEMEACCCTVENMFTRFCEEAEC